MTWKQFLIHIGTVTIGILIALSLEGLLEWNHHRHLVAEARENIRTEMEDNLRELTGHRKNTIANQNDAGTFLQWIADVQKTQRSSMKSIP